MPSARSGESDSLHSESAPGRVGARYRQYGRTEEARIVKKLLFAVVLGLVAGAMGAPATAPAARVDIDGVRGWNELALTAVRGNQATDADAARLYAMVDVAMYDAVNGIA